MFRRSGRGRLLLLVFVALSILLITLDFRSEDGGPLETARDATNAVIDPIQRGFAAVFRPVGNFFSSLGEIGNLREENERLEARVEELEGEVSRTVTLEQEYADLRDFLELSKDWRTMETVTAQVTSRIPHNYKWVLTIDKGTADGVRPDMAVIAPQGLVGKIADAEEHRSTVLLIVDPDGKAAATIKDKERSDDGLVGGNGGGEPLSFELVDTTADVDVGDTVVTSSYNEGIYPPGIPIGTIASVETDPREVDHVIEVDTYVDFTTPLQFVTILLESGPYLAEAGK